MIFFFGLLLTAIVVLYLNISRTLPGKGGKLLALGFLLGIFLSMTLRDGVVGAILLTFFTIWMCQALWMFILLDVFLMGRFFWLSHKMTGSGYQKSSANFVCKSTRGVLIASILLALILIGLGVPHNADYQVRTQDVSLKTDCDSCGSKKPFTAVYFSDIHFAPLFRTAKLERLAAQVDSIGPDFVLFGGDLSDVNTATMDEWGYAPLMAKVAKSAKVAAIAINGNHEAMQERNGSNTLAWLRSNGWVTMDDSTACFRKVGVPEVCFTGRTDFQVARTRGTERKPLADLVPQQFKSDSSGAYRKVSPWILLDHQPKGIEPEYSGILPDFALSGHTHDGQFFPGNLIIGLVWRLAYGFGMLDGVHWLVSSGIDSWGPPVRVGSDTELWVLHFLYR
ncbi:MULTISPECIES: metallophosphoesterase [unclassified Fibrobacter]|uniref:metallophosphoesterase n=1 Tax=unclassified Fibrobacter TaxID=2634177 RepID=UPI00090FF788|nr:MULTISPECIES: metallophosphoesterase [unclassified Fibrobacter]MDO4946778.1 metallophosphoesterase [Fibrobacter sp.]OWV09634.1 hypothetical protein B7992_12085 [Fibrobacter sp. UWH1]SHL49813.1 hypothetical protein SAMN05720764_11535 [Fibrobacter sp. UWH5]